MRIYRRAKFGLGVLFGLVLSIAFISVSCDTEDVTKTVEPAAPAKPTEPAVSAKPVNKPIIYHGDDIQIQQDYAVLAQPAEIP